MVHTKTSREADVDWNGGVVFLLWVRKTRRSTKSSQKKNVVGTRVFANPAGSNTTKSFSKKKKKKKIEGRRVT